MRAAVAMAVLLAGCATQATPHGETGPPLDAVFVDDAHDEAGWTASSQVLLAPGGLPPTPTGRPYPGGHTWRLQPEGEGSAWHSGYRDSYRATLTSPLINASGDLVLRIEVRGGVEQGADHLDIFIGEDSWERVLRTDDAYAQGTVLDVPFRSDAPFRVRFQLDTDASCSAAGAPEGEACGAGHDLGGYWIDSITVGRP